MPQIGDVKASLANTDHSGWFLMNGRTIDELPTALHNRAYDIGFLMNLPDCSDSILGSHPGGTGLFAGGNVQTLQPRNLPDVALDVDVAEELQAKRRVPLCTHSHEGYTYVLTYETAACETGSHAHEGTTTESMNDGEVVPFSVRQKTFGVNFFLFLGV